MSRQIPEGAPVSEELHALHIGLIETLGSTVQAGNRPTGSHIWFQKDGKIYCSAISEVNAPLPDITDRPARSLGGLD